MDNDKILQKNNDAISYFYGLEIISHNIQKE